jgi:hypothetical protein
VKLNVVRYKNYGSTLTSPPYNKSDWENKFYWSFYELSNGNIINLHYTENWKKNKFIDAEFSYYNAKDELKNGEIISFEFGDAKANDVNAMSEEFFDWFESLTPYDEIENPTRPSLEEEKCVKAFFDKYIEKDTKTNTSSI